MIQYNNFHDIMGDLSQYGNIFKDSEYYWWLGCIDGCFFGNIINAQERILLTKKVDELII